MTPIPWSFSSLSDFKNCPHQFYRSRIVKDLEPSEANLAGIWGDYVHKVFETFLRDRGGALVDLGIYPTALAVYPDYPAYLGDYRSYLDNILAMPGKLHTEQRLAITKDRAPCGFFAPEVWSRGIIDVLVLDGDTALNLDHKTGKPKSDVLQLALSSLYVFYHYPHIRKVKAEYQWLKTGTKTEATWYRVDIPEMWKLFIPDLRQYKTAFKTGAWQKRRSGLCSWCPVIDCEFWRPRYER